MSEITHHGLDQVVTPARLRAILEEDGETCFCAPDEITQWDVEGGCPEHLEKAARDI